MMKKIFALILTAAILFSALVRTFSVSADTANPTSFTADFTSTDNWSGDRIDLINTTEGYFGAPYSLNAWNNPTGSITAVGLYDFGDVLNADFELYTSERNGASIATNEDYYVTIGKFKIAICDFQTRIVVYYDGQLIGGNCTGDTSYQMKQTRAYSVHIEKGNIIVESQFIRYTSSFRAFEALDNAQVSITINETWQVRDGYFKSLTISKYVPNATSFVADFSSADGWSGDRTDFLALDGENRFGTKGSWTNPTGSITTTDHFDFGSVFDSQFSLYTYYGNGNKNNVNEDFYVTIGKFKLAICDFQTRLVLYYNNQVVSGSTQAKADTAYTGTRNYNYFVHIEAGNIRIESDLLVFESDFSDFTAVDNAAVSLTINETWQISQEYFYNFSVTADTRVYEAGDVNGDGEINALDLIAMRKYLLGLESTLIKRLGDINGDREIDIKDLIALKKILVNIENNVLTSFTADFSTTDSWTGMTEAINTVSGWFGSQNGFNGCTTGWDNTPGAIYTTDRFNFGSCFKGSFSLYTRFQNSNPTTDNMDVIIGDFTIRISAYQNQILLLYRDETVASVSNEVYTYDNNAKTNYSYTFYISKGAISIVQMNGTQRLLVLNSDFSDFAPVNNAVVGLNDGETWEINEAHFGALTVTACSKNATSFTADFSSTEFWSGTRTDLINTVAMWYGTEKNGFGNTDNHPWNNPTGSIISKENYDLGAEFHAEFELYMNGQNDGGVTSQYDAYAVNIGDFRIVVCGNPKDIPATVKVLYKGTDIGGTVTSKGTGTAQIGSIYAVDISAGHIVIQSDYLTYTSDFAGFDAVNNAQISLEIIETWQIASGRFLSFSVEKVDPQPYTVSVSADITGGTVAVNTNVAQKGDAVLVTVSPLEGYALTAGGLYYQGSSTNENIGIIQITDMANVFSFIMPDEDVTITADFAETAMTDFSVAALLYAPNNDNIAFADGISSTVRLQLSNATERTVKYNGGMYTVFDFGVVAIAADDLSAELTLNTAGAAVVSGSDAVLMQSGMVLDYEPGFQVKDWSSEYVVRPYVTLIDGNRQTVQYLGKAEQICLNRAAGLYQNHSVTASYIAENNGKRYMVHNDQPYIMNGVQAQIVRQILDNVPDSPYEFNKYIRPMFAAAADLEYDTLVYIIPWRGFEPRENSYNFDIIRMLYACADEFDLTIQLIWGGSDVCGSGNWVPDYIKNNMADYPLFRDTAAIDYSSKNLIYREKKAFSMLLEALYKYDINRRTVCIQIENEPNASIDGTLNHNSPEDVAAKSWVAQEQAVKGLINELAILAHTGPYRMLTRVNYVAYTCYFNGVDDDDPEMLLAQTNVDMVGFSVYGNIENDIKGLASGGTDNIPHVAESTGGSYAAPAKMIYAGTNGCGLLQYELYYVNGYSTEDYCVLNRDGSYRDGSEGGNVTTELIGINRMFASIGKIMAVSSYENMTAFNIYQDKVIQQNAVIGGCQIGFSVNDSGTYGGVGLAVYDESGYLYLYASKAASFTVAGAASASVGYYLDGSWVEVRSVSGTLTLTDSDAQNGYVLRVTVG